jgi:hypothetical protein
LARGHQLRSLGLHHVLVLDRRQLLSTSWVTDGFLDPSRSSCSLSVRWLGISCRSGLRRYNWVVHRLCLLEDPDPLFIFLHVFILNLHLELYTLDHLFQYFNFTSFILNLLLVRS